MGKTTLNPGKVINDRKKEALFGSQESGYKPIEDYGIIGDLHSIALVGMDGSIDKVNI